MKTRKPMSSPNTLQIQNAVTYLQVFPFIVTNGSNQVKTSALPDIGSDTTLIISDLAKQVNLKGISQKMEISNVTSAAKTIPSKLVSFSVPRNHHPEKIKIENAWVIESLNLPSVKVSKEDIKSEWEHLKDISIET